jgi:glucose/arabinose dehydrogenase
LSVAARRVTASGRRKENGMKWSTIGCVGVLIASGCAHAAAQVFHSSAGDLAVQTIAKGLDHPWAFAFLPDGRILVTERPGRMRLLARDGTLSPPLAGVPQVFASGQGGLHDVVPDRGFAQNHTVYFCYAEPVDGRARTALARARLVDEGTPRLDAVQVIFRQAGPLSSGNHFGCRIVLSHHPRSFHHPRPSAESRQRPGQNHPCPSRWFSAAG